MNLVVGFVILFCLFCNEYSAVGTADHLQLRVSGIVLLTCLVPSLALLQTFWFNRKRRLQKIDTEHWERICHRINSCHTAVWLTASIATIYALRWHDVVRSEWDLGRFVLVDEIVILLPVLLSLLASWAVFFDLKPAEKPNGPSASPPLETCATSDKTTLVPPNGNWRSWLFSTKRREFVSIRFRLYVLVLMVPLLAAVAINDLIPNILPFGNGAVVALIAVGVLSILAMLPTLAGLPWRLTTLNNDATEIIQQELDQLNLTGLSVRGWDTGNQIINAAAVGILPWFRQLWISDRLIELFPEAELKAIVRHEAAHLKLGHAAIRSTLLLMPVTVVSIVSWLRWGDPTAVIAIADCMGVSAFQVTLIMSSLYLVYAVVTLRTLSHESEFEADLMACCKPADAQEKSSEKNRLLICPQRWEEMQSAIERLAVCMPSQVDKKSVLHPSLRARMQALRFLRFRSRTRSPEQLIAGNRRWALGMTLGMAGAIACTLWAL